MNRTEMLLVIMSEECAEIQQDIAKALRFGLEGSKGAKGTNKERIEKEFNQLLAVVEMLEEEGIRLNSDADERYRKKRKIEEYMERSKELGTLRG